jgi:microsomal epoxide hydrolase
VAPEDIAPFRVAISDAEIEILGSRLLRTRWPDQIADSGWEYGADSHYLQELCGYWHTSFDWRAFEDRFNRFPQFVTDIDGQRVHFFHVRSPEPGARPLILSHGWPGSVAEFLDVLGPLSDPAAHGGDGRDAFHIVAPSLPGFGFSGPTHERGYDSRKIAASFDRLMGRLGYSSYFAQGGDKGTRISILLGASYPERVSAIHLNLVSAPPLDPANPREGLTADELAELDRMAAFAARETGYQQIQRTKPQSLAYGLNDSPAGLAAWIVEKFRTWSDCAGDVERSFSRDRLLDNISVYWLTGTINSSMRLYYEDHGPGRAGTVPDVKVPVGHAHFPAEIITCPRRWAEAKFNITRWTNMPRGGHFPAMEVPDLFVGEVRAFFRDHR